MFLQKEKSARLPHRKRTRRRGVGRCVGEQPFKFLTLSRLSEQKWREAEKLERVPECQIADRRPQITGPKARGPIQRGATDKERNNSNSRIQTRIEIHKKHQMTTAYRGTEDLRLTNEESLDVGVDTAKEEQQGQGQGAGAGQEGGSLPVLSSSITATDTTTSLMDSAQSVEQDNGEAGRNENELQRHRQQQQQEQDDETSASKPNENKAGDNDIDIDNYNDSKCSPTEPSSNANSNANSHEIQNPLTTTNFRRMAEETNSNADGSRSRSRSMKEYFNRESQLHEDVLTQRQSLPLTTTEELESEESGPTDGLPVYNVQVPPRMEDEWNPVRVALNIYKIKSIDIATARMNLNVWLRMTWKDPRLAWDPTDPRVSLLLSFFFFGTGPPPSIGEYSLTAFLSFSSVICLYVILLFLPSSFVSFAISFMSLSHSLSIENRNLHRKTLNITLF